MPTITPDTLRGDIANALQILELMPVADAETHAQGNAAVARLRSALAKLDGKVPITATREEPRRMVLPGGDRLNDYGTEVLQFCRDRHCGGESTYITLFIPRSDFARMAAFARGEDVTSPIVGTNVDGSTA